MVDVGVVMRLGPRFLRINAATSQDRFVLTAAVRDAVSAAGGWITDFRQFSNVSVCLNFELESQQVDGLRKKLQSCRLALTPESLQSLEEACREPSGAAVMATLQITFAHDEPDVLTPPPAVPG